MRCVAAMVVALAMQQPNFLAVHRLPGPTALMTLQSGYRNAVALYRAGRLTEAIRIVDALPKDQFEALVRGLQLAREGRDQRDQGLAALNWSQQDLFAAGMLHGDMALASLAPGGQGFEYDVRAALTLFDIADTPRADVHEGAGTSARDWLRAVSALLLADNRDQEVERLLPYCQRLFPDDGPLLVTRGMLAEYESTEIAAPSFDASVNRLATVMDGRRAFLLEGAKAFEHAVQVMPESDEARTRLGHVDVELHRDERAAPLLEQASASANDRWAYLAMLTLGGIMERRHDMTAAERLYRAAVAKSSGAQSAYAALALLQYSTRRRDEAAASFDALFAGDRARGAAPDAWWLYAIGSAGPPQAELNALRAKARR
ncbi:MAG: hypothetical protein ACRD1V_12595 [Vicinamibacterales bacterium]